LISSTVITIIITYLFIIITATCFFFLCAVFTTVQGDIEQDKVILVDKVDFFNSDNNNNYVSFSNYLFRGNEPKTTTNGTETFAYDLLKKYLQSSALASGLTLPDDFYLIDIKYVYDVNDPAEKKDILLDKNFFASNPSLGEARFEQVLGDSSDPNTERPATRNEKAMNLSLWQHDNLPQKIPLLKNLLATARDKPVVIYFHCKCGCDRTGEVSASYTMKYLGMQYFNAIKLNDKIAGRPILPPNTWAITWYCYYLTLVENVKLKCEAIL